MIKETLGLDSELNIVEAIREANEYGYAQDEPILPRDFRITPSSLPCNVLMTGMSDAPPRAI